MKSAKFVFEKDLANNIKDNPKAFPHMLDLNRGLRMLLVLLGILIQMLLLVIIKVWLLFCTIFWLLFFS